MLEKYFLEPKLWCCKGGIYLPKYSLSPNNFKCLEIRPDLANIHLQILKCDFFSLLNFLLPPFVPSYFDAGAVTAHKDIKWQQ